MSSRLMCWAGRAVLQSHNTRQPQRWSAPAQARAQYLRVEPHGAQRVSMTTSDSRNVREIDIRGVKLSCARVFAKRFQFRGREP